MPPRPIRSSSARIRSSPLVMTSVVAVKVADAYGTGVADQFVHLNCPAAAGQFIGADLNGDVETNSSASPLSCTQTPSRIPLGI